MLTFRNTNLFFGSLLALLLGIRMLHSLPAYFFLILILIYILILFLGSCRVDSGFYIPVICAAATDRHEIAISFDDGPSSTDTPRILDILKTGGVEAAFFCIGRNIAANEALLRRIHAEGHLIGNHSYSHDRWFDLFSSRKMSADMQLMDVVTEEILGFRPRLFRPPYGVTNPPLSKAVRRGNYIPVGWSIRSLDTVIANEKRLLRRLLSALEPGAVILLHDSGKATLNILADFIKQAGQGGYRFVRLDKLLKLNPYA